MRQTQDTSSTFDSSHPEIARADEHDAAELMVGEWLVQRELHRVVKGDQTVQIEPRIFHVLLSLADQAGRVVTRESLLESVWSDAVVNEESLTRAISELRHIFADDARAPAYIETIRKGGYRLIAPVRPVASPDTDSNVPTEAPEVPRRRGHWWQPARLLPGSFVVVVLVGLSGWIWQSLASNRPASAPLLETIPFTSYLGSELRPAISPDGSRVAFTWDGADSNNFDIYVKQRNTETPMRLTRHPNRDTAPVWSPDGSSIAFIRRSATGSAVFSIPAIGGAERLLYGGPSMVDGLDWSPDGRQLVLSERPSATEPCRLSLLALETMELRELSSPPEQFTGDVRPVFSPDGSQVAFVRGNRIGLNDLFVVDIEGGPPRRLTSGGSGIRGCDWTPGGQRLVFASIARGPFALWAVNVNTGELERFPAKVEWISNPSVSSHAGSMVMESQRFELNVWQIHMDDPERPHHEPAPLIGSTRLDTQATYSPDGRAIAFVSGRSGHLEIWVCDAAGGNPLQLTELEAGLMGNPRWSPDGRSIAFYAPSGNSSAVFLVDLAAGGLRQLPNEEANDRVTSWSRDGRWLYVASDRSGRWQLYRVDPHGRESIQITDDGGITAQESMDGHNLYFVRPDQAGIWRMPTGGGAAVLLVPDAALPDTRDWDNWVVTADGIYFTRPEIGGHSVAFFDFASTSSRPLTRLPGPPARRSLAVSPDGRSILYSRVDHLESDLMIVESLPGS